MKTEAQVRLIAGTFIIDDVPGYVNHNLDDHNTYTDDLAEQAGRLCYESWNRPNPATASNQGYMSNIIEQGHFSVMEHGSATFYIDGVTRNFTHELIRHRHLSFSEVSQRYVNVGEFDFVMHPGLADIDESTRDVLLEAIEAGRKAYDAIVRDLTDKGRHRKFARQAARHALVSGTETKIIVSGNMRGWRDMLSKRLSPTADAEFRKVAELILLDLNQLAPNCFQDFMQDRER